MKQDHHPYNTVQHIIPQGSTSDHSTVLSYYLCLCFAVLCNTDVVTTHGLVLQEYSPGVRRVWNDGDWLEYDLKGEIDAVRAERLWSEAALQAQRRNNAR